MALSYETRWKISKAMDAAKAEGFDLLIISCNRGKKELLDEDEPGIEVMCSIQGADATVVRALTKNMLGELSADTSQVQIVH